MLRTKLSEMSSEANNTGPKMEIIHLETVTRISKLPVVESAWNYAFDVYGRIKVYNTLLNWTLSTAELTVYRAVEQALPVANKFEGPIHTVDTILSKGLDIVEEKVPIVKLPPQQIYENTKSYVTEALKPAIQRAESVKQLGTDKLNAVKDYSLDKANTALSTKYGTIAVKGLEVVMDHADKYIDHMIPPTEEEARLCDGPEYGETENKALQTIQRLDCFSRKLHRRLTRITLSQMKLLRQQSHEALKTLANTLDLLQLSKLNVDPKTLREKLNALWVELSKNEPENQPSPTSLEQKSIVLARELARRLVHLVNNTRANLGILPNTLKVQVDTATKLAGDVMTTLVKTAHLESVTDAVIAQSKDQLLKLQNTLKTINSYASQFLEQVTSFLHRKAETEHTPQPETETPAAKPITNEVTPTLNETKPIANENSTGASNLNAVD